MNRRQLLKHASYGIAATALPNFLTAQEGLKGRWRGLAELPFPVQEIYPAILNKKIHVAGGFAVLSGKNSAATNRHIQYGIETNMWDFRAVLPDIRHHPNLVACNEMVYALGGYKPVFAGSWSMRNQCWAYGTDNDQWIEKTQAPEPHGETVCLALKNQIHVIGGRIPSDENSVAWIHHADNDRHLVYDTVADTWRRAAPALSSRNSAAGAVIDGLLYVVGGRTVRGGNVETLEIYDPREDKWRQGEPMPQGQGGLGAAALNNQLLAFGGEFFGNGGQGVYKEAWHYNPRTDQWSAIEPMLTPRHGLGAVSDNNFVYAIGGAIQAGGNGTSATLERFSF